MSSGSPEPINQFIQRIQNASDLVQVYWTLSDAGDRLKLFTKLASQRPGLAFICFKTILQTQGDRILRAITLKSFSELTSFPELDDEQNETFLQYLFNQIKSNDLLTQYQSITVLEQLVPPHLINQVVSQLGGLPKPLNRIKRSVLDQQIQRTSRFTKAYRYNSRQEFLDEYQDYLDFWFYSPVPELFTEPNTSENHESVIRDLLAQSPIYLLPFGLGQWANSTLLAQKVAMDQARFTFQDQTKQKELYDLLVWYLEEQQHDVSLRVQSAEIINTTGSWKQPAEKIKLILKLLLAEESLRQTAMQLLKPQIATLRSVDKDAAILLDSLKFFEEYAHPTQDNLPVQILTDLAQLQSQAQQQIKHIVTITDQGIRSTEILAQRYTLDKSKTYQFLKQQQNQRLGEIGIVINNQKLLRDVLQNLRQYSIESYQRLIKNPFLGYRVKAKFQGMKNKV